MLHKGRVKIGYMLNTASPTRLTRTWKHPHADLHDLFDFTSSYFFPSSIWPALCLPLQASLSHILAVSLVFFLFFQHVHCLSYLFSLPRMPFLLIITHHFSFFAWPPTLKYQYHQYSHLLPFTLFHHFILVTLYHFDTPMLQVCYRSPHIQKGCCLSCPLLYPWPEQGLKLDLINICWTNKSIYILIN